MRLKSFLAGFFVCNAVFSFAHDNVVVHPSYLSEPAINLLVPSKETTQPYYEIYEYFSPVGNGIKQPRSCAAL